MPQGTIQITTNPDGSTSVGQGLQTLTMTNASPTTASANTGATIVQYAQGPDGQFYIPGRVLVEYVQNEVLIIYTEICIK